MSLSFYSTKLKFVRVFTLSWIFVGEKVSSDKLRDVLSDSRGLPRSSSVGLENALFLELIEKPS